MQRKVKFTEDVEVKDHNGEVSFSAKAGEVLELNAKSATRWVRRNKAEYDEGKPDKPKAAKSAGDKKRIDEPKPTDTKAADDKSEAKA